MPECPLVIAADPATGLVRSVTLYGNELLDTANPSTTDLLINGQPLKLRAYPEAGKPWKPESMARLKGEKFTNHFAGAALVVNRSMGPRLYMKHPCVGVHYSVRREEADMTDLPCPGPGGPVVEAPLWVETLTPMTWNWKFWGEDTLMMHPSTHSSGPTDEFGHAGYEHGTPAECKKFLQNAWRRVYPGIMGIHGGLFHNPKTGHWIAITCRRPNVGYILNTSAAGQGVNYDFTFHKLWQPLDAMLLPEIKMYYGENHDQMMTWLADYTTHYYQEPPAWVFNTVLSEGLAWSNKPTWTEQADYWEKKLDEGAFTGLNYSLVTNRPIHSGTTPLGYEPDPNHGPAEEFKAMCHRMVKRGVPMLTWMSHSGLAVGAPDIDDDWFIRGIDGKVSGAWGDDHAAMCHINPGHPGYIAYTKKWIHFYIKECGVKGIFFDCLGWTFPPDFKPRSFMRFAGDTGIMAIRFMEEIHDYVKQLDPNAILLGEGASIDMPVHVFSINSNPIRSVEGWGPRDLYLQLNRWSSKRITIDQGPVFAPGSGFVRPLPNPTGDAHILAQNRALVAILKSRGGPRAFTALPGDLSVIDDLLFVPSWEGSHDAGRPVKLAAPYDKTTKLTSTTGGKTYAAVKPGEFGVVVADIYRMS